MLSQIKNNKKGISVMIGYVLLVTFAIIISVIVYNWMQSYVPKDEVRCEEGVSMIIQEYSCNSDVLNITVRNNGRFSLAGFTLYGKNSSGAEIATIDLSKKMIGREEDPYINASGRIFFGGGSNSFSPNDGAGPMSFNISSENQLPAIEITPLRRVDWNNKNIIAVCGNARIEETIDC